MGTPVKAILSGKVSRIRPEWGLVEIVPNEKTATTKVKYLHLSKIEVKKDQLIKIGDRIGLTGNIHPTKNIEPHLHLELRKPNVKVNKEGLIYSVVDPFPYF
jgi:murein DD-endopeptidase MepM/ murein hydrolase activator NlpD